MKDVIEIPFDYIHALSEVQPREKLNTEKIAEYAELMKEEVRLPPVVVFSETEKVYYLASGFLRFHAAKKAGAQAIACIVKSGTKRDAQLYAMHANVENGLPLTQEEKRKAVERLVSDPEWKAWNNNKIARWCGVSGMTVLRIRRKKDPHYNNVQDRLVESKHGKVILMNTRNIGKGPKLASAQPGQPCKSSKPSRGSKDLYRTRMMMGVTDKEKPLWVAKALHKGFEGGMNITNDSVEWANRTWLPVTGCCNDCTFCYAHYVATAKRYKRIYPVEFQPCFHSSRKNAPRHQKPDNTGDIKDTLVFVCSMSDLFGPWIPDSWIKRVMDTVKKSPWWTFIFLSKFPARMAEEQWRHWPDNAWVGASVDRASRIKPTEKAFEKIDAKVKFISCEPLTKRTRKLKFHRMDLFNWVIIGGQSATDKVEKDHPRAKVVESLVEQARKVGAAVYLKPNIAYRPKEYPLWKPCQLPGQAAPRRSPRTKKAAPGAKALSRSEDAKRTGTGTARAAENRRSESRSSRHSSGRSAS